MLDTQGLAQGAALAVEGLLSDLADGISGAGGQLLAGALENLAASLEEDRVARQADGHVRPLTAAVLDADRDGQLSAAELAAPITGALVLSAAVGRVDC